MRAGGRIATLLLAATACADASRRGFHLEETRLIAVSDSGVEVAAAEMAMAPTLSFGALLRPDANNPGSHRWLAVGVVSDVDQAVIHPGDPADVVFGTGPQGHWHGRVESVQRPGTRYPYSAEVVVEFADSTWAAAAPRPAAATVVVHPSHEADSVLAVPARAIHRLPEGPVVFVRREPGVYQVVPVFARALDSARAIVRGNLEAGSPVALTMLPSLARVAAESAAAAARPR